MTDHNNGATDPFDELLDRAAEVEIDDKARTIEETLLVALVSDPEAAARIMAETRAADFFFDVHRQLAGFVYRLLQEGKHVDDLVLKVAVDEAGLDDKGRDKLITFADKVFKKVKSDPPPLGQAVTYLDIFAKEARLRAAFDVVAKTGDALRAAKTSPDGAAAEVFRTVAALEAAERLAGATKSEGEELAPYFAALAGRQSPDNDFIGLDTGFDHLNNVINGFTEETLIVLGAAPSTGKTTLAKQLVDHVAELNNDVACLFVSGEQSKNELRVKTLSRLSGVENRDLLRGRLDTTAQAWKRVEEAKEDFAKYAGKVFVVEGDRETTPDRIRLLGLQTRQRTKAARLLIVVDYLQIIPTEKEFNDTRRQVDYVTTELRRIARDLRATVVAISSIGRASYSQGRGAMESFKESGGIEYGADVGIVMIEDPDGDKGDDKVLGLSRKWKRVFADVVKNRNGEKSRILFKFYPAISMFVEDSQESLPEEK